MKKIEKAALAITLTIFMLIVLSLVLSNEVVKREILGIQPPPDKKPVSETAVGATISFSTGITGLSTTGSSSPDIDLETVWQLVNNERLKAGLQPLVRDPQLDASAQAKCDDMVAKDYWAHDAPDGSEPWQFMNAQGVLYQTAGENLAYGLKDASGVTAGWMNSEGHKANILNNRFTNVGYAQCKYSETSQFHKNTLVVQHFTLPR